ncbi:MAG TPA: ankyrin repeat domain-containing protein [Spirochaetia bacterium]|nr:ankyrin repeat domain-containing protein [Spirochaetia bacterium]
MKVGIFCEPSQRTATQQLLRELRDLRIAATAYQLGRTWQEVNGEMTLARQVWGKTQMIEQAREELQTRGLGIAEVVFAACVAEGDASATEDFMRMGFSPDSRDNRGVPVLSLAIRGRHRDLVENLLRRGADVNAVSQDRGNTPLMEAAVCGDSETVTHLLDSTADPNLQSKNGQTALMLAVGEGFTDVAKTLLERGAATEPVDQLGMTAGKYARLFGRTEIADLIGWRESTDGDASASESSQSGH